MHVDQKFLTATQCREWTLSKQVPGATPEWIYTGRDESGLGPIYVAIASTTSAPTRELMKTLHSSYKGKQNFQLVIGAISRDQMWIFGPDEKADIAGPLAVDQGCRQLQSALDEPDALAAYTHLSGPSFIIYLKSNSGSLLAHFKFCFLSTERCTE